jgi:hypothetical protein
MATSASRCGSRTRRPERPLPSDARPAPDPPPPDPDTPLEAPWKPAGWPPASGHPPPAANARPRPAALVGPTTRMSPRPPEARGDPPPNMPLEGPRKPASWPPASGRYLPCGEGLTPLSGDPRANSAVPPWPPHYAGGARAPFRLRQGWQPGCQPWLPGLSKACATFLAASRSPGCQGCQPRRPPPSPPRRCACRKPPGPPAPSKRARSPP